MTNSNKILLSALLRLEQTLVKTENVINSNNLPISITFDFSDSYDLVLTITSAFNIPKNKYDSLYSLLEKFCKNEISEKEIINFIDSTSFSD